MNGQDVHRRGWWVAFGVTIVVVLATVLGIGQYVATLHDPREIGTSPVGEWADLSEYGLRLRVDEVGLFTELPHRILADTVEAPPPGLAFLRVVATVEVLADPDEYLGCYLKMVNTDGEHLDMEDYDVGLASTSGCSLPTELDLQAGDTFETNFIRVVLPDDLDTFEMQAQPLQALENVYWTFTF